MAEQKAAPAPEPEESGFAGEELARSAAPDAPLAGQALASAAVTSARVASDLRGWRSPSPLELKLPPTMRPPIPPGSARAVGAGGSLPPATTAHPADRDGDDGPRRADRRLGTGAPAAFPGQEAGDASPVPNGVHLNRRRLEHAIALELERRRATRGLTDRKPVAPPPLPPQPPPPEPEPEPEPEPASAQPKPPPRSNTVQQGDGHYAGEESAVQSTPELLEIAIKQHEDMASFSAQLVQSSAALEAEATALMARQRQMEEEQAAVRAQARELARTSEAVEAAGLASVTVNEELRAAASTAESERLELKAEIARLQAEATESEVRAQVEKQRQAELRAELADREVEDQKQLSQLIDGFQPAVSAAPPASAEPQKQSRRDAELAAMAAAPAAPVAGLGGIDFTHLEARALELAAAVAREEGNRAAQHSTRELTSWEKQQQAEAAQAAARDKAAAERAEALSQKLREQEEDAAADAAAAEVAARAAAAVAVAAVRQTSPAATPAAGSPTQASVSSLSPLPADCFCLTRILATGGFYGA